MDYCLVTEFEEAQNLYQVRSGVAGFHKVLTLHTLLQWCPNVVVPDQHLLQPLLSPDRALPSFARLICDCLQPQNGAALVKWLDLSFLCGPSFAIELLLRLCSVVIVDE